MAELWATGHFLDFVFGVIVLEAVVFLWVFLRTGRGLRPAVLLGQLGAGACLVLAVRAAVTGAAWYWTLLWVTASLPPHVLDLWQRWRAQTRPVQG